MGSILSWLSSVGDDDDQDGGETLLALLENSTPPTNNPEMTWAAVIARLQSHPHEAAAYCHFIDPSPLMRSLQRRSSTEARSSPSLAVVQAFLNAYPDSAYHTDQHGVTPLAAFLYAAAASSAANTMDNEELLQLHEATDQHSTDLAIVKLLVSENQGACAQPDALDRVPLHWIRTDPAVAHFLIHCNDQSRESVDHADKNGCLPLHYTCQMRLPKQQEENAILVLPHLNVLELLVKSSKLPDRGILTSDQTGKRPIDLVYQEINELQQAKKAHSTGGPSSSAPDQRLDSLLNIVEFLVKAALGPKDDQPVLLIHSLLSFGKCPPTVLAAALRRYPEQASVRNEAGRTPLVLEASQPTPCIESLLELIRAFPEAARMTDSDGRLPIDVIAEKGLYNEELFEALVQAEPRAVDTRDLKYGQHPFLTAALAGENANVASVYHLLRAKPHVISYYNLS